MDFLKTGAIFIFLKEVMKSMGKEPENILEKVWDPSESGRYWTRHKFIAMVLEKRKYLFFKSEDETEITMKANAILMDVLVLVNKWCHLRGLEKGILGKKSRQVIKLIDLLSNEWTFNSLNHYFLLFLSISLV